ncbi:PREDICTED: uncharacterized protein LOC108374221 [Rhagoletis zephyria]|uniref:uncharacterized protein LOC108374221 n=1 Tax=Rhagoletis zephyria TaxID=28612 RepID=UPI0008116A43|nr:PREDICTED: uncharacterized protein LOC108374221 [Rhagoletis zephyria]
MGNFYSQVWPSKRKEPKLYVTPTPKKATVLKAVEDIQKVTPEQMEEQFENIFRASHKQLRTMTHNPCGQLSIRIKQCLDENVQQMSKCFAVMDEYRICVSNMMAEKLEDVVTDFDKNEGSARNGGSSALLREYDDGEEADALIEELEKELKRRVEETECGQEERRREYQQEFENEGSNTCA